MGPIWGHTQADKTQMGPMLAPGTMLSGLSLNPHLMAIVGPLDIWIIDNYKYFAHIVV